MHSKITLDLFLISVGLGFFALLLFLPPAPGWFADNNFWFLSITFKDQYLLTTLPFFEFI